MNKVNDKDFPIKKLIVNRVPSIGQVKISILHRVPVLGPNLNYDIECTTIE